MQDAIAKANLQYREAFAIAQTEDERRAVREQYERDVFEAVHGIRCTSQEYAESKRSC